MAVKRCLPFGGHTEKKTQDILNELSKDTLKYKRDNL